MSGRGYAEKQPSDALSRLRLIQPDVRLRRTLGLREKVVAMTDRLHASTVEAVDRVREAARELHEAELALHDAHQTRIDCWISAAADHLHRAVVQYKSALAASSLHCSEDGAIREYAIPA